MLFLLLNKWAILAWVVIARKNEYGRLFGWDNFGVLDPVDKVHAKGWYIVSIFRELEFHLFYSPHVPSLHPGLFRSSGTPSLMVCFYFQATIINLFINTACIVYFVGRFWYSDPLNNPFRLARTFKSLTIIPIMELVVGKLNLQNGKRMKIQTRSRTGYIYDTYQSFSFLGGGCRYTISWHEHQPNYLNSINLQKLIYNNGTYCINVYDAPLRMKDRQIKYRKLLKKNSMV